MNTPQPCVTTRVTQHTVNAHPEPESLEGSVFDILVEYRNDGLWAVTRNRSCLSIHGKWGYEPHPGERSAEWIAEYRFDEATALAKATEWAPRLKVNGTTPLAAWDERIGATS